MMGEKIRKLATVQNLLWLALVLALAGSLNHVANTFSSIDGKAGLGWAQAIAVDIGLIGLALGIAFRRLHKLPTGVYWLGLLLFTVISVYANLDYAYRSLGETGKMLDWLTDIKPFVMSATLPVLALYLAEIVGGQAMRTQQETHDTQPPRIDAAEPAHQCDLCGEPFDNPQQKAAHMRWQHPKPETVNANGKT